MTLGPVTDEELALISPKSKKDPAIIKLYQEHDFMIAYARHTDYRVRHDGYRAAIDDAANWERHGKLQAKFLQARGLRPSSTLLEVGCGTGRLARKIVPYLDAGNYYGVDISAAAIAAAHDIAHEEGWETRGAVMRTSWPSLGSRTFDFLWAYSVGIHLPIDELRVVLRNAARCMHASSQFYFSYKAQPENERTGLKQFRKTKEAYETAAASAGLKFKAVDGGGLEQSIASLRLI